MKSSIITATTSPLRTAAVHISSPDAWISETDIMTIKNETKDYVVIATNEMPDRLIISNAVSCLARSASARMMVVAGESPALIISASIMAKITPLLVPSEFKALLHSIAQYGVASGAFSVIEVAEKYCMKSKKIAAPQPTTSAETRIVLEKIRIPDNQLSEIVSRALERFNSGNYQETLPLIRQVTSSRRDITDAFFIQGVTEAKLGLLPEAARSLNAVLEINAGHPEASRLLGEIRTALGY